MREAQEIIVDDVTYTVTEYSGTKGTNLFAKLLKLSGRPLGALFSKGIEINISDVLGDVLSALAENLDENNFDKMIKSILEGARITDPESGQIRPIKFDTDFAGKIGHLMKLTGKVLEFQYTDFLAVFLGLKSSLGLPVPGKAQQVSTIKAV